MHDQIPFQDQPHKKTNATGKHNRFFELYHDLKSIDDSNIVRESKLKNMKGQWKNSFSDTESKLYLEIGCHLGKTVNEAATKYPEGNFVGMDITFKRVVTTAQRAIQKNLQNLKSIKLDAKFLDEVFAPNELDGVMIFYPDPWPKKRHRKNRLINLDFAKKLKPLISKDGWLWVKMDQEDYFEEVTQALSESKWKTSNTLPLDLEPTTFESKFALMDIKKHEGFWRP